MTDPRLTKDDAAKLWFEGCKPACFTAEVAPYQRPGRQDVSLFPLKDGSGYLAIVWEPARSPARPMDASAIRDFAVFRDCSSAEAAALSAVGLLFDTWGEE